jgi:hypothetical protein
MSQIVTHEVSEDNGLAGFAWMKRTYFDGGVI